MRLSSITTVGGSCVRFSAVNPKFFQLWVQLLSGDTVQEESILMTWCLRLSEQQWKRNPKTPFIHLSIMQQNQYCGYPQIFWTNNSSDCAPQMGLYHSSGIVADQDFCLPLPVPERKRHRQNHRDGTRLCFLVVFLLILLAITGIGLAMFQIFHLQKELQEVTSQFQVGGKHIRYLLKLGERVWSYKSLPRYINFVGWFFFPNIPVCFLLPQFSSSGCVPPSPDMLKGENS